MIEVVRRMLSPPRCPGASQEVEGGAGWPVENDCPRLRVALFCQKKYLRRGGVSARMIDVGEG